MAVFGWAIENDPWQLAAGAIILGVLMQVTKLIMHPFYARKSNHLLAGFYALLLPIPRYSDTFKIIVCSFCALVVAFECYNKSQRSGRYDEDNAPLLGQKRPRNQFFDNVDVGITAFGLVVATCALMDIDFTVMAPMFFADPAAALGARACYDLFDYRLHATPLGKTVEGSVSFVIVCALVVWKLWNIKDALIIAGASLVLGLTEHITGWGLDNITVALVSYLVRVNIR